jgi:hypothetical protein
MTPVMGAVYDARHCRARVRHIKVLLPDFIYGDLHMLNLLKVGVLSAAFIASCSANLSMAPAYAQTMHHAAMPAEPLPPPSVGQALLDRVRDLSGTWDAQTRQGVMTDVFKPFALDTAVLGEEWINGKQITSTIFYVVNGELRADHYCDFKNQPRYTVLPSPDPDLLDFEFRDATNLDSHPMHFHRTTWKIVDPNHLIQDWFIMGGAKAVSLVHMEFTRRAEGASPPEPIALPASG